MKTIKNEIFRKKKIYNLKSITGGIAPTTIHKASYIDKGSGVDNHYTCDHFTDTVDDTTPQF